MISINDAVINKPTFEKIANYKLPKDTSEWTEEILKQFFEQATYLPKEVGTDAVINSVDENKGYAKGSIVVFYQGTKINYPVIIKDYELFPFDVFIYQEGDKTCYFSSNYDNIKKILLSKQLGKLENMLGRTDLSQFEVKYPGNVRPKDSVALYDIPEDQLYQPFSKMSNWHMLAKKEDLNKFAEEIVADNTIGQSFVDNTGDLLSRVISLNDVTNREPLDRKSGVLDISNAIKMKQMVTAIDSEFLDPNSLIPISSPSVCELRSMTYPTMEDFIESGKDIEQRLKATKVGTPMTGIVIDYTNANDDNSLYNERHGVKQVFISSDAKTMCLSCNYDGNPGFYGTSIMSGSGNMEKVVKMIGNNISQTIRSNYRSNISRADKAFNPVQEPKRAEDGYCGSVCCNHDQKMVVVYGASDFYEAKVFNGKFSKTTINGSVAYSNNEYALIPANVASIQRVKDVRDPAYKILVGRASVVYLVPEQSLFLNTDNMNTVETSSFISPCNTVKDAYNKSDLPKVAMYISNGGYKISGAPIHKLQKLAQFNDSTVHSTQSARAILKMVGVSDTNVKYAMASALQNLSEEDGEKPVNVYGVNQDYINTGAFDSSDKTASLKATFKKIANALKINLVKEASILQDERSVDVVLSLNFINEDSIKEYVENLSEMKRISSELAKMLIASRMGLSDIDESGVKSAITGLDKTILGLETIKMAIEK